MHFFEKSSKMSDSSEGEKMTIFCSVCIAGENKDDGRGWMLKFNPMFNVLCSFPLSSNLSYVC